MRLTRDSALLWVGAIAALLTYLSASQPPAEWTYQEWIKFGIAMTGWAIGKLQTSPLPGDKEK